MNPEVRDRVILPLLVPLVAFVLVLAYILPMSRVLLAVGKAPAVFVAAAVALGILFVSGLLAASPRVRPSTLTGIAVLGLVGLIAAGIAALPSVEEGLATHAHEVEHDEASASEGVTVTATDIEFDTDEIVLPAGEEVTVEFSHSDPEPHNIAIFADESTEENLFRGDIISGGEEISYEVGPLEAGEYYFHCDVHPSMSGTVVVE